MNGGAGLRCLACPMAEPPPSMTCSLGRDHRVGTAAGCPGCGRTMAACARRPCSRRRRAALLRPRGVLEVGEDRTQKALDRAWGAAYDIWASGGQYLARRADGTGEPLEGDSPDALNAAIRADRARRSAP